MKSSRILLEEKINTFHLLEKGQETSNRGGEVKFAQERNSYALNHSFLILENAGLEYLLNGKTRKHVMFTNQFVRRKPKPFA